MKTTQGGKLPEEEVHGNLLSRDEPGGGSGRSIYYRDIHLPLLVEKAPDVWKKAQIIDTQV